MFEKTLQDVVKGIRSNKRDPSDFISATIAEIKVELKSSDAFVKAQAVRKLTYLQMLGYDMSWAAFYVVEVMTMPRFAHKRVGYLAANQCFTEDTEVVLLCTNHLQKEFKSQNSYDVGLAINCLANIATPGLSRDLISDLVQLLGNHKPYVRKKALLAMYKLFIKYPQGLRLTFDRIKERLEDSDNSVVSCAVNVICELADKNPKNYLAMAPQFFRLLTTSSNNWMLIKVVKLLGSLVPEEPRLARKLLEPLATIIQNTAAKSLLYECIHTMTLALPFTRKADGTESKAVPSAVRLCSEHLRKFTEDPDQNLKYLGLVGFVNLMRSHPRAVAEHRSLVLACLSDDDVTIRTRALELLSGMVTKRNLEDLVLNLLQHVARAEGSYRDELIAKIIFVCSRDKYAYMSNFRWYTGVLVDLSHVEGSKHGDALALQLMDVSLRVEEVREYAVHKAVGLLLDQSLITGRSSDTMQQVLRAAAWVVGEYCRPHLETLARNHRRGERVWFDVIEALLAPAVVRLPARTQAVYVQNASKVLISMCSACSDDGELGRTLEMVPGRLRALMRSPHIEVQERTSTYYHLLVSYSIIKDVEDDYNNGKVFQPGEEVSTDEVTGTVGKKGTGPEKTSASKEGKGSSTSNGQVSAPLEVLDLLGLDPQSLGVGAESANGSKKPNGDATGNEAGATRPLMLTHLAVAPSMLGPVGAARGGASEMAALSAEVLKPVNPRAQSRVPLPEDVDLHRVVNRSAFDKLLAFQDEGPLDLSRLSFTQIRVPKSEYEDYRVSFSQGRDAEQYSGDKRGKKSSRKKEKDKSSRGGRDSRHDSATNGLGSGAGDDRNFNAGLGSSPQMSKTASDRYKSDPFYLPPGGGSAGTKLIELRGDREEAAPYALPAGEQRRRHQQQQRNNYNYYDDGDNSLMSNALALRRDGSFDDEYGGDASRGGGGHGRSSKARKDKDKDKHGRRRSARGEGGSGGGEAVDNVELMPARAVKDSDDDCDDELAGGRGRRTRNSTSKGAPSGLAAIDITTPLDEGDVLPEIKPYVRLTAETVRAMGKSSGRNASDKNESRSHKRGKPRKGTSSTAPRKHGSSKAKERSSSRREGNEGGGEPEVDLIGWGTDPASSVDPPLLLQDAPSSAASVSAAAPVPATSPAGKAMRAPPSSLQGSTWESDLSAILSAAAPTVIDAPAPAPPVEMAVDLAVRVGSGAGADAGGSVGSSMVVGVDGDVGGGLDGVDGDGGASRNTRRKSEGSSSKARKERSTSKSAAKKSSKEKKEKKRSRRSIES